MKLLAFILGIGTCMITKTEVDHHLVNIEQIIPDIVLDIRYASKDNFTKKQVYSHPVCFLIDEAADALKKVQDELRTMGFKLKIFDGYRPHAVQYIFWDLVPDTRYVGDPAKGSKHNRGCAVDITLMTLDNQEVTMPTEFDDFTEKAHSDYGMLPEEVKNNRELLQKVMQKHGFNLIPTEWWHFDYKDWQKYPILDIPLAQLVVE